MHKRVGMLSCVKKKKNMVSIYMLIFGKISKTLSKEISQLENRVQETCVCTKLCMAEHKKFESTELQDKDIQDP